MDEYTESSRAASRRRSRGSARIRAIVIGTLALSGVVVAPALVQHPVDDAAVEHAGTSAATAVAAAHPMRMPLPGPEPAEPGSGITLPGSSTTSPTPTSPPPTEPPSEPDGIVVQGRSFPSAATTGVPDGVTLSPYTGPCTIETEGVVIDAKIIDCDMRVLAQGLVITDSIINGRIYSDDAGSFNGSFSMTDSEVRMPPSTGTGVGDVNFVLTRVEVTGGSRSVNCGACTVQDSYLHGQYTDLRGIDHESAIRMGAGSSILRNTITCDAQPVLPDAGCSAALTGYGDFGVVEDNTIDGNLIDGGPAGSMGFCAYGGSTPGKPFSEGVNNIRFTNNIFMRGPSGQCGIWGPIVAFDPAAPGNVWRNNIWDDGTPVPPAN